MMKWSLNTYRVCQDWELDRILEVAKATGFQGIEFLMDYQQKHGIEWDASPEHRKMVKQKVDASGLEFASLTSCVTFHSLDDDERKESCLKAKKTIEMADEFGCKHVRVLGDRLPEDDEQKTIVITNIGNCLKELGDYAAGYGIAVSIEMHGSFSDPELALRVIKVADRPNVGFVFNSQFRVGARSGWSLPEGARSIEPLYDMIAEYITLVHTHQMDDPKQFDYYQEMFNLLKADGYSGYVSYEGAYVGPDPEKVLSLYTALFKAFIAD
jgi:sugar phosphate isomerase/epimerase